MRARTMIFVIASILIRIVGFAQQPKVLLVSPSFNAIAPNLEPVISVTFDQPVDSASCSTTSFFVFSERSGRINGSISSPDDWRTIAFTTSTKLSVGERVRVVLSKAIRGQGGDSLQGFAWSFQAPITHATKGSFSKAVAYDESAYSMQVIDLNGDGYPDIALSSGSILLNDGSGRFTKTCQLPNADAFGQLSVGDINSDGNADLVYASADSLEIALGNGKGGFEILGRPRWFTGFQIIDLNNTGFPDIMGYNRLIVNPPYDTTSFFGVALNDGAGHYTDTVILGQLSCYITDMALEDVDNDGFVDVILAVQPITTPAGTFGMHGIMVFRNDGKGRFPNVDEYRAGASEISLEFPEHLALADYNRDGYVDIAVLGDMGGGMMMNLGTGTFGTDSSHTRSIWGAEALGAFTSGDFDGNGWVDLVVSGYRTFADTSQLTYYSAVMNCSEIFRNCGGHTPFNDTLGYSLVMHAANSVDIDLDGDLDLVHAGNKLLVSFNSDSTTGVPNNGAFPLDFAVKQNYPNPFNGTTFIPVYLDRASNLAISVYDIAGRLVGKLIDQPLVAGHYSIMWDGTNSKHESCSSGTYFVCVKSNRGVQILRAMLIR